MSAFELASKLQHARLGEVAPEKRLAPLPASEFESTHDPSAMSLPSVAAMTRPNVVNDFYQQHSVHVFDGDTY